MSLADSQARRQAIIANSKRIVVKIGSGVLTGSTHRDVVENTVASIAQQVAKLIEEGRKVAIVSSGSVAIGARLLGIPRRGLSVPQQQAAAALGQGSLISLWDRHFAAVGFKVGQMLLTHDDMTNRRRFINARNTVNTLNDYGIVPIINENDTVSVQEIKFGDNDSLAAKVTNVFEADLLAILSDVDGLYSGDPRLDQNAHKIEYVEDVDESILSMAGDSSSMTGLGGMASKVRAAAEAARFGAATMVLPGTTSGILSAAMAGEQAGTFFFPHDDPASSKKHWIEFTLKPRGTITVDAGAKTALVERGKSLLPLGVTGVTGDFEPGEAVLIAGPDGVPFAKGLVNYHSREIEKIKGKHSREIEPLLGYKFYNEITHRDDMALLGRRLV
jgi:glutamate 5-kinase